VEFIGKHDARGNPFDGSLALTYSGAGTYTRPDTNSGWTKQSGTSSTPSGQSERRERPAERPQR
jgi:hypothetical protein